MGIPTDKYIRREKAKVSRLREIKQPIHLLLDKLRSEHGYTEKELLSAMQSCVTDMLAALPETCWRVMFVGPEGVATEVSTFSLQSDAEEEAAWLNENRDQAQWLDGTRFEVRAL